MAISSSHLRLVSASLCLFGTTHLGQQLVSITVKVKRDVQLGSTDIMSYAAGP